MKYCLDTSSLMDMWMRWYPIVNFPTLWGKVHDLITAGQIVISEEVFHEVERKTDGLFTWLSRYKDLLHPIDDDVQYNVKHILRTHPRLIDERAGKSFGDPFVIATACVAKAIVVTGESGTNSKERPKIPDVCLSLKIRCISTVGLIQSEKWTF